MEDLRTLETSFTTHDNKKIDVVYTNKEETVVRVLRMYEGWLGIDEDKFVGLDLEYTLEHPYEGSEVAIVQLDMQKHIIVYHLYRFVELLSVANRF